MNNIREILEDTTRAILEVASDYKESPAIILNEDGMKCRIYAKLMHSYGMRTQTRDNEIKGCSLHTEISYFNEDRKLRYRPDISLIDPSQLSIIDDTMIDIGRKGFVFYSPAVAIELKFCHSKAGISEKNVRSYKRDITKLRKLIELSDEKLHGYLVVFNKQAKVCPSFEKLKGRHDTNISDCFDSYRYYPKQPDIFFIDKNISLIYVTASLDEMLNQRA
jgi:hypothetical protein